MKSLLIIALCVISLSGCDVHKHLVDGKDNFLHLGNSRLIAKKDRKNANKARPKHAEPEKPILTENKTSQTLISSNK